MGRPRVFRRRGSASPEGPEDCRGAHAFPRRRSEPDHRVRVLCRSEAARGSISNHRSPRLTPVSRSETSQRLAIARLIPTRRKIGLRTGGPLFTNRGP